MALKRRWLAWFLPLIFLGLILWSAWHRDPDFWRSGASLHQAARELSCQGETLQALELARKAWNREPGNTRYGVFLGWLYLERRQPREALEVFRRVLSLDGRATGALKGQAQALELLGDRAGALRLLEKYLREQPRDREMLQFAAQFAARSAGDQAAAIDYYQRLYQETREPQVRRQLLDLLIAGERFKEALPLQEEEAGEFPENQEAWHRLALLHYWQQDYQAAAQIYQQLLARGAQDAALRREAAQAANAAGQVDQALSQYLWLYGRYQGKPEYALALARLWSRKGNHAETAAVLAPLVKDKPEPELRRWYALELLLTRDFAKSLQAYEAAWQAGDTHQETIVNLARLYAQKRHFAKAAAFWDEASRRQLLKGDLAWEAALTYSYARRYGQALETLGPLHRRDPQNPKLLLFMGQLHLYQENWGRAAHYFSAYLKEKPGDDAVRQQLAEVLSFKPETREEALGQYAAILKRRDDLALRLKRIALLLQNRRWQDAARELKNCPRAEEPRLLREQARLCLWLGDLDAALAHFQALLSKEPRNREASLEMARVLIYLGRAPEALEVLRTLRVGQAGVRLDQPGDRVLLTAHIEAALAGRDWPEAQRWALRLFCSQFPEKHRPARDWTEARSWLKEGKPPAGLDLEERTWVARALCHHPDLEKNGEISRTACDLVILNLRKNRYHHPSLLILAYLLPRLPRYEDLSRMVRRLPGIRADSPEYVAALAFFDGNLGRQGGKLDYLLHVLQEYRRHRWPHSPGELLALAELARELGDTRAASRYLDRALALRPGDQRLAALKLQVRLDRKDWGGALKILEKQGNDPAAVLKAAHLYLYRGQYEGVKAAVQKIPAGNASYPQALLLQARACRLQRSYPEALKTLERLSGRIPQEELLMERAQVLEGLGDKQAAAVYEEIIRRHPESQAARVARARRDRSRGDWARAYRSYAQALKQAPQDIELLNELEYIRQQMRPQVASRSFPYARGERRPEEGSRPWQFSRYDREYLGRSLASLMQVPQEGRILVLPEAIYFTDSNKLYGGIIRFAAGFWITKVLPVQLAVEYREYNQNIYSQIGWQEKKPQAIEQHQKNTVSANRLRRAEVALSLGPLTVGERLRLSGEIIGRGYWRRIDQRVYHKWYGYPNINPGFPQYYGQDLLLDFSHKENRNRLFGSLSLGMHLSPRTEATLTYSRRDIFDQDPHLYPRLYQGEGVLNLEEARITGVHQVDLAASHQFRPGLDWRGSLGGAFFSDNNRRLTVYQGLFWQALKQPRMQLEFNPHVYLAAYRQRQQAYFSPGSYLAMGLGLNFHRQFFRLPTIILQGTAQGVGQHGDWGPALHGLAALEWEPVHNFFFNPYVFYFREWVDNYRLLSVGLSCRYAF
ncbi:MAG: tetratricopeptide repeat protein [Syntrophales bacterium]|nr:tetratricopeptide repeat protein [Syntrophales bacterium]